MNKAGGVGIGIVIIVLIIGVVYSMSSSNTSEDNLPTVEDINFDESISVEEEIVSEEPEQTGNDFSVEFSESIGLTNP
jgi:hypothetical protein